MQYLMSYRWPHHSTILARGACPNVRAVKCSSTSDDAEQSTLDPGPSYPDRSKLVDDETVLFIVQQEMDVAIQRALNAEQFERVQLIRRQRELIEARVEAMQSAKRGTDTADAHRVSTLNALGLQLRSELQRAIEDERFTTAAQLRDQIADLERQTKQLQSQQLTSSLQPPQYRLGQRFTHAVRRYRGVIIGWDQMCCEDDEWQTNNEVKELEHGAQQPFYHVLIDLRDRIWEDEDSVPPSAYVAQDLIRVPEDGTAWVQQHGNDKLNHPFATCFFLGNDARGDYIPIRQLRSKYNIDRWDVHPPSDD